MALPACLLMRRLWPRRIGNQCLLMLAAGVMIGRLGPAAVEPLDPLATLFLQVSQVDQLVASRTDLGRHAAPTRGAVAPDARAPRLHLQ